MAWREGRAGVFAKRGYGRCSVGLRWLEYATTVISNVATDFAKVGHGTQRLEALLAWRGVIGNIQCCRWAARGSRIGGGRVGRAAAAHVALVEHAFQLTDVLFGLGQLSFEILNLLCGRHAPICFFSEKTLDTPTRAL